MLTEGCFFPSKFKVSKAERERKICVSFSDMSIIIIMLVI